MSKLIQAHLRCQKVISTLRPDCVIIATLSSLLHTPVTLANRKQLTAQQKDWFSFVLEGAEEVVIITAILLGSQDPKVAVALEANQKSIAQCHKFEHTSNDTIQKHV